MFAQFLRDSALYGARGGSMVPHDDVDELNAVLAAHGSIVFLFADLSEARCLTAPQKWLAENHHEAQEPVYDKPRIVNRVTEVQVMHMIPLDDERSANDDDAEAVSPSPKDKKRSRGKVADGPYA
jgi:hypothetical protein